MWKGKIDKFITFLNRLSIQALGALKALVEQSSSSFGIFRYFLHIIVRSDKLRGEKLIMNHF